MLSAPEFRPCAHTLLLIPVLLTFPACSAEHPQQLATEIVDSAGIRIVENNARSWRSGTAWSVEEEPVVSIGTRLITDSDAYALFRVTDASRLSNGGVAIANSGTSQVRIFGPDGVHSHTFGREGDGPGEFRNLRQVMVTSGDTVVTWDGGSMRIGWFTPEGQLFREHVLNRGELQRALKPPLIRLQTTRMLSDGHLVSVLATMAYLDESSSPDYGTLFRLPQAVVRNSVDLERWDTLIVQPGREAVVFATDGPMGLIPTMPAYQRDAVVAWGDRESRICTGDQSVHEISCFSSDGTRTIIRWSTPVVPATQEDLTVWRDERFESLQGLIPEGRLRSLLSRVPSPETRQPYGRIFLDTVGNLWVVRPPALASDSRFLEMTLFDRNGHWLGDVTLPDMTPLEIGNDYVIGLQRDDSDVEYVRVWKITKPAV